MLKIVRSGFSSAARDAFISAIAKRSDEGQRSCLIVPEQQTVMAESLMSLILPPSSVLCFEVTNFTRLANTAFRALGGLSGEYCDSAKKSLIMWRTLTELSPTLSMTAGRREINAGLVEQALSAVSEMQSQGIQPSSLAESELLDAVSSDRRLSAKLCDLSAIYSLYKNLLGSRYADTGDDAEAMIRKLRENPGFLSDTEIFIEGFTSFTEPQYRLIALLAARTDVSVSLILPKGREDAFEFSEIAECQRRLISSARKEDANIKLAREEGHGRKSKESLSLICDLLWSTITPNDNISLQNPEDLRIFEAKNPYEECMFVCEDIRRRVMNGARYSDFAIVARGVDKYEGILDTALSGAKIPAFTSYRREIQEFEAIKLIYTAYSVCRGFRREDVISYAKCALCGVSREECDEFEMYVNKWQINGRRFTDDVVWNMNPRGYTSRRKKDTDEKLLRIHNVREKIITPLSEFAERAKEAKTVRAQAECLLDFLLKIDLPSSLERRADTLRDMGENSLSDENRALWRLICSALDTLVTVLGDLPTDTDGFLSQLKVVFSATDIGRIPAYVDQVTVGSADMLRLYEKPYVYLIGVNAGEFPATVSETSYFSERDRRILSKQGIPIEPELEIKGARELYIFSRAFSYGTESVTLSYSSSNTRFKPIEPAEVIGRISDLTGKGVVPVKISSLDIRDRLFSPNTALESVGELEGSYPSIREALVRSGYEKEIEVLEGDISNGNARLGANILRSGSKGSIFLSQSEIDSYINCPFGHFCRYTIELKADERAEFDARSIGSFIHGILENFFRDLSKEGKKSGELTREERAALTKKAAEKYIASLGESVIEASVATKIKIDRLCRAALPVVDGLCDEFRESSFEPRFFEYKFNSWDDDAAPSINIKSEGGEIKIHGTIDRVDTYKKENDENIYVRVIDYKTGHKEFSPDDMAEGKNLQMFLYLKALVDNKDEQFLRDMGVGENGRLIPAGVIYVKTDVSDVKVDTPDDALAEEAVKAAQGREGMILESPEVISATTLRCSPVYSPKYPTELRAEKRKFLYDEEGWNEIMNTVEGAVKEVAKGIRQGEISADPKEQKSFNPCDYCEFKPICRRA